MTIIRDPITGRFMGTKKTAPPWATEQNLKHMILMPALRQVSMVLAFYQGGKSTIEIAAEMGVSKFAVRTLLMRVRRALGVKREPRGERIEGVRSRVHHRDDQFAIGFEKGKRIPRSKGRHFHPVIDEAKLTDLLVGPSLKRYEIARLYWLEGLTQKQVAERLGVHPRAVEFAVALLRRQVANPTRKRAVPTGMRSRIR